MGYVAVKGGSEAIERACELFAWQRGRGVHWKPANQPTWFWLTPTTTQLADT